ncbi:hypothetical protein BDFB_011081 [Asbolus verrucosus]|uniref:Uncharacterized protein n=1 Tax=Asbolus verrucosus TaxID=1661398 RepID=A0A482VLZ6_ASBVE|nr:hypothetical protein BDFB_011081 [Asbolus verrucosus]
MCKVRDGKIASHLNIPNVQGVQQSHQLTPVLQILRLLVSAQHKDPITWIQDVLMIVQRSGLILADVINMLNVT